jgi:predicted membrane GTPase involved in stress response
MEIVRPLEVTVAPRMLASFPNFSRDLLSSFAGKDRLDAVATDEGLVISGVWEPDLDLAAEIVQGAFPGDVTWSKPRVRYILAPRLLEPILQVEVRAPTDNIGSVVGDLSRRRGMLLGQTETPEGFVVSADVPLAELFGYLVVLRMLTQGRGEAAANFVRYQTAPWRPDPDEPMAAALRA